LFGVLRCVAVFFAVSAVGFVHILIKRKRADLAAKRVDVLKTVGFGLEARHPRQLIRGIQGTVSDRLTVPLRIPLQAIRHL